jgi:hypothetical protein
MRMSQWTPAISDCDTAIQLNGCESVHVRVGVCEHSPIICLSLSHTFTHSHIPAHNTANTSRCTCAVRSATWSWSASRRLCETWSARKRLTPKYAHRLTQCMYISSILSSVHSPSYTHKHTHALIEPGHRQGAAQGQAGGEEGQPQELLQNPRNHEGRLGQRDQEGGAASVHSCVFTCLYVCVCVCECLYVSVWMRMSVLMCVYTTCRRTASWQ